MDLRLTWDLFILVFFAIIIAYSFILGKDATLKIILGSYASALGADAAGNLFNMYLVNSKPLVKAIETVGLSGPKDAAIVVKIVIFVTLLIFLTIKGSFSVQAHGGKSSPMRVLFTGIYGFLSAALIVSTILMYISGISFITGSFEPGPASILAANSGSPFIQKMLDFYNLWFLLPVVAMVIGSFLLNNDESES